MQKYLHSLQMTTAPAAEPLVLSDVKTHIRVDHTADDALLTSLITAAREACEHYTGRALITRSYSLWLDEWPCMQGPLVWWDGVRDGAEVTTHDRTLLLPYPPCVSVDAVVMHAADDLTQTYAAENYYADVNAHPARLILKDGASVPSGSRVANSIEIRYQAGYGVSAAAVPAALRQGLLQWVAHVYEHRGDDTARALQVSGAAGLFHPYKVELL